MYIVQVLILTFD